LSSLEISVNGQDMAPASDTLAAIDTATSLSEYRSILGCVDLIRSGLDPTLILILMQVGGPPNVVEDLYAAVPNAVRGEGTLEGFWTYRE
jgi:hypothetical protein